MIPGQLDLQRRQFALNEIEELGYFRSVQWLESTGSTNKSTALAIQAGTLSLPALLVTDRQTSGVGRGANSWWSPAGCLMFSMAIPLVNKGTATNLGVSKLCDTDTPNTRVDLLPLRVGYTVAETLEPFVTHKPMLKWPNDVYIADRKVCGVLIEVVPAFQSSGSASVAVIGIGINCEVDFHDASKEIASAATSVHSWAKPQNRGHTSPESVLVEFLHQWIAQEKQDSENPAWLSERWAERSLLDGKWVEVNQSGQFVRGVCLGISATGGLLLQDEQLQITEVMAGSINSFMSL